MSTTEVETQSAAAAVARSVLETAARNGDEHAAEVLGVDVPTDNRVEAPPERVVSNPTPTTEVVEELPAEAPVVSPDAYEPQLTEELAALLSEPDFDEEARAEIAAESEETYFEDTEAAAKVRALEKRNAFLEQRVVESSKKNWVNENLRAYPLLREYAKDEVAAIQATSRRAFAREAAALNTRLETIAKPMLADLRAAAEAVKAETTVQAQQEVRRAWGNPAQDTPGGAGQAAQDERLRQAQVNAQRTGEVKDIFRAMLDDSDPL